MLGCALRMARLINTAYVANLNFCQLKVTACARRCATCVSNREIGIRLRPCGLKTSSVKPISTHSQNCGKQQNKLRHGRQFAMPLCIIWKRASVHRLPLPVASANAKHPPGPCRSPMWRSRHRITWSVPVLAIILARHARLLARCPSTVSAGMIGKFQSHPEQVTKPLGQFLAIRLG